MLGTVEKLLIIKGILILTFFTSISAGFAARIVPAGNVSIIEGSHVLGRFDQEAQLPEGFLLRCEDRCVVKLDNIEMEIEPHTAFSVSPMPDHLQLKVQYGTVFYSINPSALPLHFHTAIENVTIGNLSINDDQLKGYVSAANDLAEIGILGGGTMLLNIGPDIMAVVPGEKLVIAVPESREKASENTVQDRQSKILITSIEPIDDINRRGRRGPRGVGRSVNSDADGRRGDFSGGRFGAGSGGRGSGDGSSGGRGSGGGSSDGSSGDSSSGGGTGGGSPDGSSGGGGSGGGAGGGSPDGSSGGGGGGSSAGSSNDGSSADGSDGGRSGGDNDGNDGRGGGDKGGGKDSGKGGGKGGGKGRDK